MRLFILFLLISVNTFSQDTIYVTKESCKIYSAVKAPNISFSWSGACVNGFASGIGKRKYYVGDSLHAVYEGKMINGRREGKGKVITANYSIEATFLKDTIVGKVDWRDNKGNRYIGGFIGGKRDGKGKWTYKVDSAWYEGDWKNGQKHGYGKEKLLNGVIYEGDYVGGQQTGKGKFETNIGRYEGEMKNGLAEGQGKLWYANGNYYEGMWKAGETNGYGKFIRKDGSIMEGDFEKGRLIRDVNAKTPTPPVYNPPVYNPPKANPSTNNGNDFESLKQTLLNQGFIYTSSTEGMLQDNYWYTEQSFNVGTKIAVVAIHKNQGELVEYRISGDSPAKTSGQFSNGMYYNIFTGQMSYQKVVLKFYHHNQVQNLKFHIFVKKG